MGTPIARNDLLLRGAGDGHRRAELFPVSYRRLFSPVIYERRGSLWDRMKAAV
jgi:hypothetical protein